MYKLMLVDDTRLICDGLKDLINWPNYGIEIVYVANSGEDALEFLYVNELDIMITDVRMPGISGIELLQAALQCQPHLQCLVLSGYDDYELVRSAMRAGALDYLLKPVDPNELEQSIAAIISNLDANSVIMPYATEKALLGHTLQRLLHDDISPKERMEKLEFFRIDPNPKSIAVGLIRFEDLPQVSQCVEDICREFSFSSLVFNVDADIQCILFLSAKATIAAEDIRHVMQHCANTLQKISAQRIHSAASTIGQGWRQVPKLYEQASFYLDYSNLRHTAQESMFLDCYAVSIIPLDIARLRLLLFSGTPKEIYQYLDEIFQSYNITQMGYTADSIALSFLRSAMSLCIEMLVSPGTLDTIRSKALGSIAKADSLSVLKRNLVNTITELAHTVLITPKGPLSPYVSQLLEIITAEYTDSSLGLKLIADRLFVNATYLGRQFKIETGFYFNDYLARIRIRQAEILLVSTDYMVADVASKVGFSSVNYFCQVFKKITSLTPSDVRDASNTLHA